MKPYIVAMVAWTCILSSAFAFQETPPFQADKPVVKTMTPSIKSSAEGSAEAVAWSYVRNNWQALGLANNAENLVLDMVKYSLRGGHVHFKQTLGGVPIERTGVVVSLDKDKRPYRVRSALFEKSINVTNRAKALLDDDDALDVAWHHLAVGGGLRAMPEAQQAIVVKDGQARLIYRVMLAVDQPFGSWSLAVDALTGEVLEVKDLIVWERAPTRDQRANTNFLADRERQTKFFKERQAMMAANEARRKMASKRANGRGLVFDPDPRTTLVDDTMEDTNPASDFDAAYLERDLLDITQDPDSGEFFLDGPWAQIRAMTSRFTAPNTEPSTTADGVWTAKRGDNAFNDAMTYFHLDQNQRYIQSLGYEGPTGIQYGPINADTDGWNGADNSFFDPSVNAVVFGHGCVDDNEDADVILHEYGHALHQSMLPGFAFNEDEGAIGEGFGDYWAVSYSIKTPNGLLFNPHWMFSWDGHNNCWSGRVVNQDNALYQSSRNYDAHEFIGQGNIQSDELWSTPLVASAMQLYQQGIPLSESDTVVLEGHFGTVLPLNIPELAQAKVDAARDLYPNGPHGDVFQQFFARHNMLPGLDEFEYIAPHVPPAATAADWISEMVISNGGEEAANVSALTYEAGPGGFSLIDETDVNLSVGQLASFSPPGSGQRWVRFVSDQPLAGTFSFTRTPGDERGAERAVLPLVTPYETSTSLILPHVPADRASFWSGAVVVNPTDATVSFNVELIGENGSDLSDLLNDSVPSSLPPFHKGVTFLAEGPGGIEGMFDDSGSAEKVSWVRISSDGEIAAFQLYGYNAGSAELATTGIIAQADQPRSVWPVRVDLSQVDWNGFSVLNPTDQAASLKVTVYGDDLSVLDEADVVIGNRSKILGLNATGSGFNFPASGVASVSVANGASVRMVTIESDAPLRIFGLTGDFGNTVLDGTAVDGMATRAVYNLPSGEIEIFKLMIQGEVIVRTNLENGTSEDVVLDMQPGQLERIAVSADNIASIEVLGEFVTSTLIQRDDETLSVQPGRQVIVQP